MPRENIWNSLTLHMPLSGWAVWIGSQTPHLPWFEAEDLCRDGQPTPG